MGKNLKKNAVDEETEETTFGGSDQQGQSGQIQAERPSPRSSAPAETGQKKRGDRKDLAPAGRGVRAKQENRQGEPSSEGDDEDDDADPMQPREGDAGNRQKVKPPADQARAARKSGAETQSRKT